jgi:hypothetical protein
MRQTKKAYVVQRVRWVYRDRSEPLLRDEEGAGVPVKVFADRDRAEAHCRLLHRRAAKKAIPFEHGCRSGTPTPCRRWPPTPTCPPRASCAC